MQHPDEKLTTNVKKQVKHLEQTLETYVYSHYNMYNITIYFCNIKMKHLQHPDKIYETLETQACNMLYAMLPCCLDEVHEQRGHADEGERRDS
jgi:hypothetical protein